MPELITTTQTAHFLGVGLDGLRSLIKQHPQESALPFPPPVKRTGHSVYRDQSAVHQWATNVRLALYPDLFQGNPDDLLTLAETAAAFGRHISGIAILRKQRNFPEPNSYVANRPLFLRSDLRAYALQHAPLTRRRPARRE